MNHYGSLYGLKNTNRQGKNLWGKNQFNSTFPAALACYMRDRDIEAVYINAAKNRETEFSAISIGALFNASMYKEELFFDFESRYEPFRKLVEHELERVDLVVRKISSGEAIRPLEIKLTVIPDNTTCKNPEDSWFPEIVIRPATIMYCCMSIASNITQAQAKEIFNPVGKDVRQWGNVSEAEKILGGVTEALNVLQEKHLFRQQPLILQPIWRTKGKQPILDDNAFDLFVWSDYALLRVILDIVAKGSTEISRFARSLLRISRYLYEYGRAGTAHINNIFADMTYGLQSDKEFSLSGMITQRYMNHPRMRKPILGKDSVREIILQGGEEHLSPERRLDQTIYFAYKAKDSDSP